MKQIKEKIKFANGLLVYSAIAVAAIVFFLWVTATYIKKADENMMKISIAIVPIALMFAFFAKFLTEQEND